ncbi:MAG: 2-oxoglutarate and iron-dependent oxygenase domain-containing protein [Bacteroidota bacterium]|nr:2-oxoglutarate and iron-dependent oxygenase domain-containing protein [Bacteroidota bacterium]
MSDYLSKVPTLDISKFTSGNQDLVEEFSEDLGNSFNQTGFAIIKNHGLTEETTKNLYSSIQTFFELDDEKKVKYYFPELYGQRGYVIKGQEHAKGSSKGDLKEFFHIGNPAISNPKNIWPIEVDQFEEIGTNAFLTLENIGLTILEAIALFLNLDKNYFENKVKGGESIMRSIHYYPLKEEDVQDGAVRAGAHGDINLITLLMGASADGLEILTKEDKWIPIISEPDQLVINVGDMLERLTNKKLMSTVHRVVNPSKEKLNTSRYSIPFFMHPRPEMDLTCLENCIDDQNPKSFDDMTAGEFLEQRLREIGLKK